MSTNTLSSCRATVSRLCLVAVAVMTAQSPAHGAPGSEPTVVAPEPQRDRIDELMATLAAMPGLYARFTETKTIDLLAVPIENRGALYYDPPRLLRAVDEPHASRVLLLAEEIWVVDGAMAERVDLSSHPAARAFVGSFRALLAGRRAELAEHFDLELHSAEDGQWTLALRPSTPAMAKIVTKMKVSGHDEIVQRLVIHEASGDISDTRFEGVDPRRRYAADEAAKLFKPPR